MKPNLYTRLHLWLVAHRRPVLILTLLSCVAAGLISSRIDLDEDLLATLPRNDQRVDEYRFALEKFRQIDRVYLDVAVNRDDPDLLAAAADEFHAVLSTNSDFSRIMYRVELSGAQKVIGQLAGALPNLFSDQDAAALERKLDPVAVREYLTTMRRKLAGPEGMMLKDLVAADPVGSSSLVLAKALPLQTGLGEAQIIDGRITSADGRHVLLRAEPNFPPSNTARSEALVENLLRLARDLEQRFPGVQVAMTGGHRMTVDNALLIKGDAARCILLGMAAMLVLCLTAFRRRWLAVVAFLPSLFGSLAGGVVLALWQPHLSAIAVGFAVIATGITVDYAIHVIYHLDDAPGIDRVSVGQHVGRLVLPISIGSLTTVAAFLVMAGSPMRGYQQLGVLGAVGVLASAAFALVILPVLVPVPERRGQPPLWLTCWMERFHHRQTRGVSGMLVGVLVVSVVTGLGVKHLRFEGDVAKLNGITASTRQDEERIRLTWGDAMGLTLVVTRGTTVDEALSRNDQAAMRLALEPGVTGVNTLASICPSQAVQEANFGRWRAFWTRERRMELHQALDQVGSELGFRGDAFATFWARIEGPPPILTLDSFRGTPIEAALNERVAINRAESAIITMLKLDDPSRVVRIRAALPGAMVLDGREFTGHIARVAKGDLRHFAGWTGLAVAVILYLTLASIELVLITLLPLAVGLLWTLGMMGWLGLPIDLMNSVFVIFIIGIGEDYSVFLVTCKLDEWRGQSERLAATSASVLISALTTIFGFAVLVLAHHPVLFSIGTTVLIGMISTFVATLLLTPLCMDLLLFKEPPRGAPRAWHLFGTLWITIGLGESQLFLYGLLRPILKLVSPRTADDRLRRATRRVARGLINTMPFGKLEWQNVTQAAFTPPCIVVSNHQSAVDVMLMVALPGDVRQTAKKRVFDTPILGIGCKLLGHVMVEPDDPDTTLQRCREKLGEGASVHFYPEGTRSHDGFLKRFHRGAFELAVEMKQEILPVVVCDSNTALPRDAYWFEPFHVTVRALPRITPQNFDYSQGVLSLLQHCESIVRQSLQQQLDEVNTPRVVRRKVERLYRYQGIYAEQFAHWKMRTDPLFPDLDAAVPREGYILDLGCGYGLATHWLAAFTDQRSFLGIDFDEEKIRVARRTASGHRRIQFEHGDIQERDYPMCDAVLLLDVLHYWTPDRQQKILNRVRSALRPGGRLVLREAARAETKAHARVHFWERFATAVGQHRRGEGLYFQSRSELEGMLKRAGFDRWEIKPGAPRDSNYLLIASVAA